THSHRLAQPGSSAVSQSPIPRGLIHPVTEVSETRGTMTQSSIDWPSPRTSHERRKRERDRSLLQLLAIERLCSSQHRDCNSIPWSSLKVQSRAVRVITPRLQM